MGIPCIPEILGRCDGGFNHVEGLMRIDRYAFAILARPHGHRRLTWGIVLGTAAKLAIAFTMLGIFAIARFAGGE